MLVCVCVCAMLFQGALQSIMAVMPVLLDAKAGVAHPQVRAICDFFKRWDAEASPEYSAAKEFTNIRAALKVWLQKRLPLAIQARFEGCGPFAQSMATTVATSRVRSGHSELVQRTFTTQLVGEVSEEASNLLFEIASWITTVLPLCSKVKVSDGKLSHLAFHSTFAPATCMVLLVCFDEGFSISITAVSMN